jgi:myosin tail region-interacting protein MTI1
MSDPPPPKPKPGSLRDRIAQFETKPVAPSPPAPRPKPGGLAWKPRPQSPPESTGSGGSALLSPRDGGFGGKAGGMSASDAKESISQGGSLKDRMAALQGKGAFGQPAPPPPKPSGDKPKWKPPPKPASPPQDEKEGKEASSIDPNEPVGSRPSGDDSMPKESDGEVGTGEGTGDTEPDAEEEERQRRAAIAARMARLGGARVGMAPPVFGTKPSFKKTEAPKEPETLAEEGRPLEPASGGVLFNLIVLYLIDIQYPSETSLKDPPIESVATPSSLNTDEEAPGGTHSPLLPSSNS